MRALERPSELIAWAAARFGPVTLRAEHSWPHGEARVLELATNPASPGAMEARRFIVKQLRQPVHFERERAGCTLIAPVLGMHVPRLLATDEARSILALEHLPGTLAQHHHDHDRVIHARAARLLRRLHEVSPASLDAELGSRMRASFERFAARSDGLVAASALAAVRGWLIALEGAPVPVVGCHGDYSPRNWLIDTDGEIRVIDFARYQRDHWLMDVLLLARRYWARNPALRDAFLEGYGRAIEEADQAYLRAALGRWAVGTIVWAREHADAPFERLGADTLAALLEGDGRLP